jgi:hypothetical protein
VDQYLDGRVDFIKADIEGYEWDLREDWAKLVSENKQLLLAIASYHIIEESVEAHVLLEKFISSHENNLIAKTVFSHHPTTYILHKDCVHRRTIETIPSYTT